jgi:HlyD family secretion protein
LRLAVALSAPSHAALRHKLRVDVRVVTARRADALTVKATSFALPDGSTAAWVIRDGRAVKTPIRLGITAFDAVEVLDGLSPGDEVLLRDMSEYANLREVRIR